MAAADEKMKEHIAKMVLSSNYWGYLFSLVRRVPSDTLPSIMGVSPNRDGTINLMYRPDDIENTSSEVISKILEHEGQHLLNQHIPRLLRLLSTDVDDKKKFVKSRTWNVAADCAVNLQIKMPEKVIINGKEGVSQFPKLYKMPDDKASEWYFEELMKNEDLQKMLQPKCGGGCNKFDKDGNLRQPGQKSKGQGDDKGEEQGQGEPGGEGGAPGDDPCSGCKLTPIDSHDEWFNDDMQHCPDMTAMARKLEQNLTNTVRESVRSFRNRGTLPAGVEELINEMLNPPKLPYHMMVRKLVQASKFTKFKRSSTRINRKRTYVFTLDSSDKSVPAISPFPGRMRDFTFNIGVLLDTSGSMSIDDITEGLSGIKGMIENDKHTTVTVIENDTEVNKEYKIKKIKDIQFNIKGRGGTTLGPGLHRFQEIDPDIVLVFTDGGTEDINAYPRKDLPKKLLWILTAGASASMMDRTGPVIHLPD